MFSKHAQSSEYVDHILVNEVLELIQENREPCHVMENVLECVSLNEAIVQNLNEFLGKGKSVKLPGKARDMLRKAKKAISRKNLDDGYKKLAVHRLHGPPDDKSAENLLCQFSSIKFNIPAIPEFQKNPSFPNASVKLELTYSVEKGRHVICKEDIKRGEAIFAEPPLQFTIDPDYLLYFCNGCGIRVGCFFIPCLSCCEVMFCSKECRDTTLPFHRYECGYVSKLNELGSARLILRLALSTSSTNPGMVASEAPGSPSRKLWYDQELEPFQLLKYAAECSMLVHYLDLFTDYFYSGREYRSGVAKHLFHIKLQLAVNMEGIEYYYGSSDATIAPAQSTNSVTIGIGIYTSHSTLNHSCVPNTHFWFSGSTMVVIANRNIAAGEEITNCYRVSYKIYDKDARAAFLKENYGFICACLPCKLPGEYNDIFRAYKCVECSGPLVPQSDDPSRGMCWNCQAQCQISPQTIAQYNQVVAIHDKALDLQKTTLMRMIRAWRSGRKVMYHSNDTLVSLAVVIRSMFFDAKCWFLALPVAWVLSEAVKRRYDYPCTDIVGELQILALVTQKNAEQYRDDIVLAESFDRESLSVYTESKNVHIALCGLTEPELEMDPVFKSDVENLFD